MISVCNSGKQPEISDSTISNLDTIDGNLIPGRKYGYDFLSTMPTSTTAIAEIVPAVETVALNDADIGFVKVGLPVNVSVDSFPSGEFGYISGTLVKLGSDVLPPDQEFRQYRFPAIVSLKEQSVLSGDQSLNLQSGMGISANIKLRSRPVISIISDLFTKQLEGVKRFR